MPTYYIMERKNYHCKLDLCNRLWSIQSLHLVNLDLGRIPIVGTFYQGDSIERMKKLSLCYKAKTRSNLRNWKVPHCYVLHSKTVSLKG